MVDMFDVGVARGMDLGHEEGYIVAKKGFDGIVEGLRAREAPKSSTNDTSTQTDPSMTATVSASVQTNPISLIATMLHLPEHPEYRKGTKRGSTSEISSRIIGFSSSAPPITSTSLPAPSTTSPALEMHEKMAEFTPKVERKKKTEKQFISTQTTPRTSSLAPLNPQTR
jgi:hypothetical protein